RGDVAQASGAGVVAVLDLPQDAAVRLRWCRAARGRNAAERREREREGERARSRMKRRCGIHEDVLRLLRVAACADVSPGRSRRLLEAVGEDAFLAPDAQGAVADGVRGVVGAAGTRAAGPKRFVELRRQRAEIEAPAAGDARH